MGETTECSSIGQIILQDRPSRDATDAAFISLTPIESSIFDSSKHRIRKIGLHIGPAHSFAPAPPTTLNTNRVLDRFDGYLWRELYPRRQFVKQSRKNLIEITLSVFLRDTIILTILFILLRNCRED